MVKSLTTMHQYEKAIASSSLTLVDFMALWCIPCLQIAPKIADLEKDYPDVHFYKIDVDHASDIATHAGITAMPTFHFYKNGNLVDKVVGANLAAIKKKLQQYA